MDILVFNVGLLKIQNKMYKNIVQYIHYYV